MPSPFDGFTRPNGQRSSQRLQLVDDGMPIPSRRAISVLYVEDDADDVFLLDRQLNSMASFIVDFAHAPSLAAARSMMTRTRFDVVLCDFWLGCETTIPLIDELKGGESPCPVVLVSSLENDDIELIGRRAGAAGFVAKADLSAAALDRIFSTLLPEEPSVAPVRDAAGVLHALMLSLDKAAPGVAAGGGLSLERIAAASAEVRASLAEAFGMLDGARRPSRVDAVPFVIDAVSDLRARAGEDMQIDFVAPEMPIAIETSPAIFGDLLQGLFADTIDTASGQGRLSVHLHIRDGQLGIELTALEHPPVMSEGVADGPGTLPPSVAGETADEAAVRAAAAAETRRLIVEALARAAGGRVEFGETSSSGSTFGVAERRRTLIIPIRNPV